MFGIVNFGAFILSAIVLNLTPGADTIYVLSRSATGGRARGIASALGISTGILIHTVLAALGLSVILSSSALAFNLVKLAGALYLIVMGSKTIRSKESLFAGEAAPEKGSTMKVYRQGVLTNTLNPKVALFFLALLPQFVSLGNPYGMLPFLLLGLTFVLTSTLWSLFIAYIASFLSKALNKSPVISAVSNKVAGMVYVLLGVKVLCAKMEA